MQTNQWFHCSGLATHDICMLVFEECAEPLGTLCSGTVDFLCSSCSVPKSFSALSLSLSHSHSHSHRSWGSMDCCIITHYSWSFPHYCWLTWPEICRRWAPPSLTPRNIITHSRFSWLDEWNVSVVKSILGSLLVRCQKNWCLSECICVWRRVCAGIMSCLVCWRVLAVTLQLAQLGPSSQERTKQLLYTSKSYYSSACASWLKNPSRDTDSVSAQKLSVE